MLILNAPLYLQPGDTVLGKIRLDPGGISTYLTANPLRRIPLVVHSLLSPTPSRRGVTSALPSLQPAIGQTTRFGLLPNVESTIDFLPAESYIKGITLLQSVQRSKSLASRIRAARQVGSLLCWLGKVKAKRQTMPRTLKDAVQLQPLVNLARVSLQDTSPLVRAEMLVALQPSADEPKILSLTGLVFEDPSPWVRFRAVELLGVSTLKGCESMLAMFAKDSDAHVRRLAELLLRQKTNAAKAKAEADKAKAAMPKEYKPNPLLGTTKLPELPKVAKPKPATDPKPAAKPATK